MEKWKWINGWKGYYKISTHGRVKSVRRTISRGRMGSVTYPTRILKGTIGDGGYVHLTLAKKGVKRLVRVHRLVAEAFVPNPDNLPEVNHKDLDKTNNQADNLEWSTEKDNMRHAIKHGRRCKVGPEGVKMVVALRKRGMLLKDIAFWLDVIPQTVRNILRTWKDRVW